MKQFVLIYFTLFFAWSALANDGLDFFKSEVHPVLLQRCFDCHGIKQNPYHSTFDADSSYPEALRTINLNFPEKSTLWQRSFNGHCGKPKLCGFQDENFKTALMNWIAIEAESKANASDDFVLASTSRIQFSDADKVQFVLENGSSLTFEIQSLDSETITLENPQWTLLTESLTFEGFEIRSSQGIVRYQNFTDASWVFRPSEGLTQFVDHQDRKPSYLIYNLMQQDTTEVELELWLKKPQTDVTTSALFELFQEGFKGSIDQAYFSPVHKIFFGAGGPCANFISGEVNCWSRNYYASATTPTYGDEPGEMKRIKPSMVFPENEKIVQIVSDNSMYYSNSLEFYLTETGKVFYILFGKKGKGQEPTLWELTQSPLTDIKKIHKLREGQICFSKKSGELSCLEKNYRRTFFYLSYSEWFNQTDRLQYSNNLFNRSLFKVDSGDSPITQFIPGPAGTTLILHENGKLKAVDLEIMQNLQNRNWQLPDIPYIELKDSRPILNAELFIRGSSYHSHLLILNYGDSAVPFYYSLYGGNKENKEQKLARLASSAKMLFPPGEKLIKMVHGTDILCMHFDSGRIECTYVTSIHDDYSKDYKQRVHASEWETDTRVKNAFTLAGPYAKDIDKLFHIDHTWDTFCATLRSSDKILCFGSRQANFTPNSNFNQFIIDPDSTPLMVEEKDLISLGTNLKVTDYMVADRIGCFVFTNGRAKCFGTNRNGQLGLGNTQEYTGTPAQQNFMEIHSPQFLFPEEKENLD